MIKNKYFTDHYPKTYIAITLIILMIAGLFISRAVLSMSMILFGVNGLIGIAPRQWLKQKWWLLGVIWVGLYAVSYFWSNNSGYWNERVQVKLPVLLLPLAFAYIPAFRLSQLAVYTIILNLVMLYASCYSLYFLVSSPGYYISGYDYSHLLPTVPENDHIVFSMFLAAGVVWNVFMYPKFPARYMKWLTATGAIIFSIVLHVVAARTGLLAWYLFLFCWLIYLLVKKTTRKWGLLLLAVLSMVLWQVKQKVPTLEKRVGHIFVTLNAFKHGDKSGNYSDIGRYLSYDIAWKLIKTHPIKGVGAGNILDTMKERYARWYPEVKDEQRLIPHNQFLVAGVAAGVPALLFFIAWIIYPLTALRKNRDSLFFFIMWCMLLVPLFVDPFLEIQFGVFVYLFFLLMQRHAMLCPAQKDITQ